MYEVEQALVVADATWRTETNKLDSRSTMFEHAWTSRCMQADVLSQFGVCADCVNHIKVQPCYYSSYTRPSDPAIIRPNKKFYFHTTHQVHTIKRKHLIYWYFFERSRPPEEPCMRKFLRWGLMCLKESGWGPPGGKTKLTSAHIGESNFILARRDVKGKSV